MGNLGHFPGRALAVAVLCHLCAINVVSAPVAGSVADPRTLEWEELVPPGWEPPVIAPAYDAASERLVDQASLVPGLDGLLVKLPGFLRPVVFSDGTVTEFLLVPFLPYHVKQHVHLEPNQMVYVVLDEPAGIDSPFEPLWVTGTLTLQTVVTDDGPAAYKISGAEIQDYRY